VLHDASVTSVVGCIERSEMHHRATTTKEVHFALLNAPYMLAFIAKKKVIPHPLELTDNGLALTEGGPQRRPRTQDVRAVVGVALTASGREDGSLPKPLLSKLVRLGRGPAAKTLQTRIWLGGETNGPSIASGGYKPEGPGAVGAPARLNRRKARSQGPWRHCCLVSPRNSD